MRLAANIISFLFHPFFLPTYAFIVINLVHPYLFAQMGEKEKKLMFGMVFINTFLFPVIVMVLMKWLGFIKSIYLRSQKERILPFIAVSLFYFWTYLAIKNIGISEFTNDLMLGISLSVFMAFFINLFNKISVHAVGAGGFFGIMLALSLVSTHNAFPILIATIIIAGIIGTSRVYLKCHRTTEIYTGYMIGLLGQMIAFKVL